MLNTKLQNLLQQYNISQNNRERCQLINRPMNLHIKFSIHRPQGKTNLVELFRLCSKSKISSISKLKYLMLIHYIIMKSNETYDWILENEIFRNQISHNPSATMGIKEILELGIQYYYTFIKKLCINSKLYEQIKYNSVPRIQKLKTTEIMEKLYILINLIKSLEPLKNILVHLGRYYINEYQIFIDFDQILATDLAKIYNYVQNLLNVLSDKVEIFQKEQLKLFINILDEIFIVHEILYVFLYNRYYQEFITIPEVNWFTLTNISYEQMVKKANVRHKKKQLSDDIHLTDFESTYFEYNRNQEYGEI